MLSEFLEQLEESLKKEIRMRECQHALRVHIEAQTPSKMLNIHAWVRFGLLTHQQLLAERHSMQKSSLNQVDLSIVSGGSCISRKVKIFQIDPGSQTDPGSIWVILAKMLVYHSKMGTFQETCTHAFSSFKEMIHLKIGSEAKMNKKITSSSDDRRCLRKSKK